MGQIDNALGAEVVVIQLQNFDRRVHLWVERSCDELASEGSDSVVEELQEECGVDLLHLEELADLAASFILTERLPHSN